MRIKYGTMAVILTAGTFTALGFLVWPEFWQPVNSATIRCAGKTWSSASVVKSPEKGDRRYFVYERSSHENVGYLVDMQSMVVILQNLEYYTLCGCVFPKDPVFTGAVMNPKSEKAPYDPHLFVAPDKHSFRFNDRGGQLVVVTGL